MKIKISILNEFNTELSVYSTDLDSYELNKKHNISIERSIDQMIHKIHFEQNLDEKNTEISNKSDSKKSEIEIKIGEYCECISVCNEYENKTCKGVEKRKTNKMKQTTVEWLEERINTMWTPNAKELFEQAKEMEKQQKGYSEFEVENILIEYVKTNPTKPYRVLSWFGEFKKQIRL